MSYRYRDRRLLAEQALEAQGGQHREGYKSEYGGNRCQRDGQGYVGTCQIDIVVRNSPARTGGHKHHSGHDKWRRVKRPGETACDGRQYDQLARRPDENRFRITANPPEILQRQFQTDDDHHHDDDDRYRDIDQHFHRGIMSCMICRCQRMNPAVTVRLLMQ